MTEITSTEDPATLRPGSVVHVGSTAAVVEDVDARGRVRARTESGAEVSGVVRAEDKAWPPTGYETK